MSQVLNVKVEPTKEEERPVMPLTAANLKKIKEFPLTRSLVSTAPSPIKRKRRPSLDELLSLSSSGAAQQRLEGSPPKRVAPHAAWQLQGPSDKVSSSSSSSVTASFSTDSTSSSCYSIASTETAKAFMLRQAEMIHDQFAEKAASSGDGNFSVVMAGKPRSFREVLALTLPRLSASKVDALATHALSRAAALNAAVAERARAERLTWAAAERAQLHALFAKVDADGSGRIDMEEFVSAFLSGGKLSRQQLEATWRDYVTQVAGSTAGRATSEEDAELEFEAFMGLLEAGGEQLFEHARNVLAGIAQTNRLMGAATADDEPTAHPTASTGSLPQLSAGARAPPLRESLLVMDDGKQQLWRLCPGSKALVRKVLQEGHLGRRPSLADPLGL